MNAILKSPSATETEIRGAGEPDISLSLGESTCSLWWGDTPRLKGERIGCIGQLEIPPGASAAPIIELALEVLRSQACTIAIGPMDGNTWRNYRTVTFSDGSPLFPFEPSHSSTLPDDFIRSGFSRLAEYSSSSMAIRRQELTRVAGRIASRGISIRPIKIGDLAAELSRLHGLSTAAFSDNFLYTPLCQKAFVAMYASAKKLIDPRFVLIAEDASESPAGFVFSFPNPSEPESLIVKTLAVRPEKRHLGLGSLPVAEVQNRALDAGAHTAIHALQHRENSSLKITARHGGHAVRGYTLFSKPLR